MENITIEDALKYNAEGYSLEVNDGHVQRVFCEEKQD